MKLGTLDLTKFKRLVRQLGETIRGTVGLLELIWMRAAKDCPQGDVGRLSNLEIAIMADWSEDPDALVTALVDCGWLDPSEPNRLLIHDWPEHAPNWLRGVVKKKYGGFLLYGSQPCDTNHELPTMDRQPTTPLPIPTNSIPSPPPPIVGRDSGDVELEPLSAEWEAVAAELALEGVRKADHACLTACLKGCLPQDGRRALEYWRSNRPAWSSGALYYKILGLRPSESASIRWPSKSAEFEKLETSKTSVVKVEKQVDARAAVRRGQAAAKAERKALETKHGSAIDAMSNEKLREFVQMRLPKLVSFIPVDGPVAGTLRDSILGELELASEGSL